MEVDRGRKGLLQIKVNATDAIEQQPGEGRKTALPQAARARSWRHQRSLVAPGGEEARTVCRPYLASWDFLVSAVSCLGP